MESRFEQRLDAIAWGSFGTAYGPAVKVPDQLGRIARQRSALPTSCGAGCATSTSKLDQPHYRPSHSSSR